MAATDRSTAVGSTPWIIAARYATSSATRSEVFREWWATHNVRLHRSATKRMRHSVVGELELTGEALDLPGDQGLTIITYVVEPASASAEALTFLVGWASRSDAGVTSRT